MPPSPKKIEKIEDERLRIIWEDDHESEFTFRRLRQLCPCASCKDEWTGRSLIDPEAVSADLTASRAELVGSYALTFGFSDGHSTGLFTFEMLRRACGCRDCGSQEDSKAG